MERGVAPFCPVCDEIIGLQDLSNILSEAELVKMLNAYPLTHSAVPSSLQSCTHCQGAVTIDAAVNDFEFVDNLVTLLLFKIDDMKPLSKAEVLACYEGKDNSDLLIYNRVARRFLTGAENSAGMTLSVEDRKQNYSWKLERCDAKISDKKVQIGGLRLRNANVKSALQNDGDGRTVTSSISEDSKASQFIMASEKDGEFAFAHVATRRYLQANEGGELGMYAPASAYVMNPTKVTLPTARTTVWTFFKAPQTAEQLIDSKFVARCTRCSGAAPVCAGCGKAPHHGAGSSPCEAAIYLRVQLTLETLDCISDLVSVRKFVEMKEEKDSKGDAKKRHVVPVKFKSSSEKTSSGKSGVGYAGPEGKEVETSLAVQAKAERARAAALKRVGLTQTLSKCLAHPALMTRVSPAFYAMLFRSRVNSMMGEFFRVGSIMEMLNNSCELGIALLDLAKVLCSNPRFLALLRPNHSTMSAELGATLAAGPHLPIAKYLSEMQKQAKHLINKDGEDDQAKDSQEAKMQQFCEATRYTNEYVSAQGKVLVKEQERFNALMEAALAVQKDEEAKLAATPTSESSSATPQLEGTEQKEDGKAEEKKGEAKQTVETKEVKKTEQQKAMEDFLHAVQFGSGKLLGNKVPLTHIFKTDIDGDQAKDNKRLMRIRTEMAALASDMPPGVFVRFDETRLDVVRFLIIGAEGTPYQNGCFFFDMHIPQGYPAGPPKCKIITTGKGAFRFNPNLYTNGKVCLSLLGTWSGPGWDPHMSTMKQVFLSIQAMIMCADPIANEPGWESKVGTSKGRRFNLSIQHATMLFAMKWHLESPMYGFEDIIKAHFWLNKDKILQQVDEWYEDSNKPCDAPPNCNYGSEDVVTQESVQATVDSLKELLTNLQMPQVKVDSDDDE